MFCGSALLHWRNPATYSSIAMYCATGGRVKLPQIQRLNAAKVKSYAPLIQSCPSLRSATLMDGTRRVTKTSFVVNGFFWAWGLCSVHLPDGGVCSHAPAAKTALGTTSRRSVNSTLNAIKQFYLLEPRDATKDVKRCSLEVRNASPLSILPLPKILAS